MTVSFVAANDVALTKNEDDSSLMELKGQWLDDYREILELLQEDKAEAFKEAKILWTDISAFTKPKSNNGPSDVTRSVVELRDAVMKLMLSLALQIDEHQFIIDTCLKCGNMDVGLWDTLGKAMMAMGTFTPAALRLVFEKQVELSPAGSISAKSHLYKLLESIGDYESLAAINDKAKDMLFKEQSGQIIPKYESFVPEQVQFENPRVRTAALHERTWSALLNKLVQLYEDDEMLLSQPLRLSVTQDEPVVSQLTKDMNTLAMSFSRRPSIEDLATRTSKRRKDTGNGSAPKKTKQQMYEELDVEGFFKSSLGFTDEDLLRIMSKAHTQSGTSGGQDLVPLDFFTACQAKYRSKEPLLIYWIQFTLSQINSINGPTEPSCASSYLSLVDSQPQMPSLKKCYALCSVKPDGWRLSVKESLSNIESNFVNGGHTEMEHDNTFACHYHFLLGLVSSDSAEALFHFNSCKAKLLKDHLEYDCFGFSLDTASVDHLISKIMFKTKLDDMEQHMTDPSWFKVHLFNNTDLGEPGACLSQISAADLHEQIILSTLEMLIKADLYGKAHRWLSYGFQLAMEKSELSQMISSFLKLSEFTLRLMSKSPITTLDKSVTEPLILCSMLMRDGAEYEDKDNISTVLAKLWPAICIINPPVSEFAWKFLSIGLSKTFLTEFLRNLTTTSSIRDLSAGIMWNALRVINGIVSPFDDSEDPFVQMEPLGVLDMKKTSAKSFEKVHMPLETLRGLLDYGKEHDISDEVKYAELLEYLTTGLSRTCSSVVKTNTGILERHMTSSIEECFGLGAIKLYTGNGLDVQVGKGLYRRVKYLSGILENKKRTAQIVRGWRDDLVKSLSCHESSKTWNLLSHLSLEVIDLELSEDMDHINDARDDLLRDVRIALVALSQIKAKAFGLAKIFLLLLEGPIQFLCNDDGLSDGTLISAFAKVFKPSSDDDPIVLYAMVQLAIGYPDKQVPLLLALLKSVESFEHRYQFALMLLELMIEHPELSDKPQIGDLLIRIGLINEEQKDSALTEWATEIGSRDKKKVQLRHLFLIAQSDPSLNSWSALFPFLTKSKSAGYSNVWQCDQDLPGMHLCYKAKYTKAMLTWVANNESVELFTLACKKIVANLLDMYDPDSIVALALNLISTVKSRFPDMDISQPFNVLKKACDDKDLIIKLKSELKIV